jgi:hypothetical protein
LPESSDLVFTETTGSTFNFFPILSEDIRWIAADIVFLPETLLASTNGLDWKSLLLQRCDRIATWFASPSAFGGKIQQSTRAQIFFDDLVVVHRENRSNWNDKRQTAHRCNLYVVHATFSND